MLHLQHTIVEPWVYCWCMMLLMRRLSTVITLHLYLVYKSSQYPLRICHLSFPHISNERKYCSDLWFHCILPCVKNSTSSFCQILGIGSETLSNTPLITSTRYWWETKLIWMKAKGYSFCLYLSFCLTLSFLHTHAHTYMHIHLQGISYCRSVILNIWSSFLCNKSWENSKKMKNNWMVMGHYDGYTVTCILFLIFDYSPQYSEQIDLHRPFRPPRARH